MDEMEVEETEKLSADHMPMNLHIIEESDLIMVTETEGNIRLMVTETEGNIHLHIMSNLIMVHPLSSV
jgi:hypothetical protein